VTGEHDTALRRALSALLCVGGGVGFAQGNDRLQWPAGASRRVAAESQPLFSEKSNVVLDFHGSVQDPDLGHLHGR